MFPSRQKYFYLKSLITQYIWYKLKLIRSSGSKITIFLQLVLQDYKHDDLTKRIIYCIIHYKT